MQCSRKLKVTDLNPHLICVLCGGYFVNATTIIECLHSFCRSCIVKYLETNKYCPICDVQVHKTRPLQNIRPDDTLQTIVYKLVPGLYQNEMRCRREFYAKHPEAKQKVSAEARGELTDESGIFVPDEPISLCLEYVGFPDDAQTEQRECWGRRYLRCPAAVSVLHLHKLIRAKFGLTMGHRVDVFYKDDFLPPNWTLIDIAYIYEWKRKSPIHLSYQILESQRKRIKLSHEPVCSSIETVSFTNENSSNCVEGSGSKDACQVEVAANVSRSSNDTSCSVAKSQETPSGASGTTVSPPASNPKVSDISNKDKDKIQWKEVQLQISENGVMSVANVDIDRFLNPIEPASVPVSSQNDNLNKSANKTATSETNDTSIKKLSENKVPQIDSDSNSSALQEKDVNLAATCESRTKPVESTATSVNSGTTSHSESSSKNAEEKISANNVGNQIENVNSSNKCSGGFKLPNSSDKTNAIFKSKTDKLEDTVRNIANRNEPAVKATELSRQPHGQSVSVKETTRPKVGNTELVDGRSRNVYRPMGSAPKVYPGVKPPVYNSLPKEEHVKSSSSKYVSAGTLPPKLTPMEILNTQGKMQSQMTKYKSHKASIKPWNPSISRAAVLAMKHASSSKESNSTADGQLNPPPVKQPRFFKIRNMPRFLGNPASGVKPMYQVAPGSEIVTSVASGAATVGATCATTSAPSVSWPNVTAGSNEVSSKSSVAVVATAAVVPSSTTVPKAAKSNISPSLTLMKIDPKTLSPITINPVSVSHVVNNPPRSASSPQPKKLPPPFTPGSPKHSNQYTNCRTGHTNGSGKNNLPRTPSPAHTGGLLPTHPFIPVPHASPHLLYGAFPNPFAADPSGNRLLTGPTNSELIRAMSALCSPGSAFHPSLPPSISMLFNPPHVHHRPLQTDRTNFKCNSNDKLVNQSSPPAVQRVPPSNTTKGFSEPESQNTLNSTNCKAELSLSPSRSKKPKLDSALSPTIPVKSPKSVHSISPVVASASIPSDLPSTHAKRSQDNVNHHLTDLKSSQRGVTPSLPVSNNTSVDSKNTKTCSTSPSKSTPGEKIAGITSELLAQNRRLKVEQNSKNVVETESMTNRSSIAITCENVNNDCRLNKDEKVNALTSTNNENRLVNSETKPKDEQLKSLNNNNDDISTVTNKEKTDVVKENL